MKQPTHIDLFAGPGGIATGFRAAGFKTILAVEHEQTVCDTYIANHPETKVLCADVRDVTDELLKDELKKNGLEKVNVVTAGFPCETFSTAGSKSRVYDDHRNFLYKEAIRIADTVKADILMLENVPAFLSKSIQRGSPIKIYDLLIEDLEKAGFKYHHYEVVHAIDFGVPQTRSRFILIASKKKEIGKFSLKKVVGKTSVDDAFSDLPLIGVNQESVEYRSLPTNKYQKIMRDPSFWGIKPIEYKLSYHITPKHRPGTIKRFQLVKQGEGLKDIFTKHTPEEILRLQEEKILPKKWYIQRNYRLISSEPSKTVTSHCLDELVHPTLDRGLSVREVARLQSFPDWYDFKGGPLICPHLYKTQDKYEQVGDAVPPLLAKALGEEILKVLSQQKEK